MGRLTCFVEISPTFVSINDRLESDTLPVGADSHWQDIHTVREYPALRRALIKHQSRSNVIDIQMGDQDTHLTSSIRSTTLQRTKKKAEMRC